MLMMLKSPTKPKIIYNMRQMANNVDGQSSNSNLTNYNANLTRQSQNIFGQSKTGYNTKAATPDPNTPRKLTGRP